MLRYESDPLGSTAAFDLLNPAIQRWIYREGWTDLRDVQGEAVFAIRQGGSDVLISAPTAAGKTEAAFLPLLSRTLEDEQPGIRILYLGPLKALINDQFSRLQGLCEELDVPVHPWHGDIGNSRKKLVRKNPSGIVLITPESLEALFVNHGSSIPKLFSGLSGIIIDEAHSFIGTERGAQLQSLLHRVEVAIGRRVDRIGLSATLGDPSIAANFIRPGGADGVKLIASTEQHAGIRAAIIGFEDPGQDYRCDNALFQCADHIYLKMRGTHNLVFANSRTRVEALGDLLVQKSEKQQVPLEFAAHHGNLSKEIRSDTEERLKEGRPFTVVCTSTLEMGIDVGNMASVAQIGSPPNVASLRQRVGRSGRRGKAPPTLWMYSLASKIDPNSAPIERLRAGLFQQTAMLELMIAGWCEPPRDTALHFSTLVQQCLSAVAERGGMSPRDLFKLVRTGPFWQLNQEIFIRFLKDLGSQEVLESSADGTLLAGRLGERMLAHYSFYAAFSTPDEYRVICDGRTLGTLPIIEPLHPEGYIIFAALRWKVIEIDDVAKVILVKRAAGGKVPMFGGDSEFGIHATVRARMRELYESDAVPAYLDVVARRFLLEGRRAYADAHLDHDCLIRNGGDVVLFPWSSDSVGCTLSLALKSKGLEASGGGFEIEIKDATILQVLGALRELQEHFPNGPTLAALVSNKRSEKHDHLLGEELMSREYERKWLDVSATMEVIRSLPL